MLQTVSECSSSKSAAATEQQQQQQQREYFKRRQQSGAEHGSLAQPSQLDGTGQHRHQPTQQRQRGRSSFGELQLQQ